MHSEPDRARDRDRNLEAWLWVASCETLPRGWLVLCRQLNRRSGRIRVEIFIQFRSSGNNPTARTGAMPRFPSCTGGPSARPARAQSHKAW